MKMKNYVVMVSVVLGLSAAVASASVYVNWTTGTNSVLRPNLSQLPSGNLFLAYWSVDQSSSGFNALTPLTPSLDDFLGAYSIGASAGRIVSASSNYTAQTGGYAYFVAYDVTYSSFNADNSVITAPSVSYGISAVSTSSLPAYNSLLPSQVYRFSGHINTTTPLVLDQTVVPEPATLGLLGAGVAMMAWRRSRQKKQK